MLRIKSETGVVSPMVTALAIIVLGAGIFLSIRVLTAEDESDTDATSEQQDEAVEALDIPSNEYTVEVPADWVELSADELPYTSRYPSEWENTPFTASTDFNGIKSESVSVGAIGVNDDDGNLIVPPVGVSFGHSSGDFDGIEGFFEEGDKAAAAFGIDPDDYVTYEEIINGERWVVQELPSGPEGDQGTIITYHYDLGGDRGLATIGYVEVESNGVVPPEQMRQLAASIVQAE